MIAFFIGIAYIGYRLYMQRTQSKDASAPKLLGYTFAGGAYTPVTKLGIVAKRAAKGAPIEETTKAAEAVESATEEETETE